MDINRYTPHSGRYLDESNVARNIIEGVTGGINSINSDHGAIHVGIGYCAHLFYTTLAAGTIQRWRFVSPTNNYMHIKSIQAGQQGSTCAYRLVKDVTIVTPGTEEDVVQNLNHNSTRANESKIYDGGVTYTGGNTWCEIVVTGDTAGAVGNKSVSGGNFIQSDYLEYVTKNNNTDYILEIENIGTDPALNININMFFYEEPRGLNGGV